METSDVVRRGNLPLLERKCGHFVAVTRFDQPCLPIGVKGAASLVITIAACEVAQIVGPLEVDLRLGDGRDRVARQTVGRIKLPSRFAVGIRPIVGLEIVAW